MSCGRHVRSRQPAEIVDVEVRELLEPRYQGNDLFTRKGRYRAAGLRIDSHRNCAASEKDCDSWFHGATIIKYQMG
jgi:hypothetical protein